MFTALVNRWRHSLAFRVVASTLVAATLVVGVSLGLLLIRVTNGLVDANTSKSIAEANVGLAAAQQVVLQSSEGGPPTPSEGLADALMSALLTGSEAGSAFEVLLLDGSGPAIAELPERGTNLVQVSSVPVQMRAEVQLEGQEVWTYTTVRYVDSPDQPGLVVGLSCRSVPMWPTRSTTCSRTANCRALWIWFAPRRGWPASCSSGCSH